LIETTENLNEVKNLQAKILEVLGLFECWEGCNGSGI